MTRAKDDLHLIVPQRFFTHGQNPQGDRHVYASRTRFIPNGLLILFEKTTWPITCAGPRRRPQKAGMCGSTSAPGCGICGGNNRASTARAEPLQPTSVRTYERSPPAVS